MFNSFLHNYFDVDPTKLFSDLCPAKFLDASAKLSFHIKQNKCLKQKICMRIFGDIND